MSDRLARLPDDLRDAWRGMRADLIAVSGHLDTPYPDDPRWTPWTRFVERGIRRMDEALARLDSGATEENT